MKLHAHIWPADHEEWEAHDECIEPEHSGTYDDHIQYSATLPDGRLLEIRLPFAELPAIVQVMQEQLDRNVEGWNKALSV